ncbi:MAG: monovalent cation/H+ antiporter complex subunit F [Alcanivorax sp.]
MLIVASFSILFIMALALLRAFLGPTIFDRILAVNMFGTKTVLLIAVLGVASGEASFIDIAIVYALINFVGVIALLRFFEYGKVQAEKAGDE